MPTAVTTGLIFGLSVLATVALQQTSPTKQWPGADAVVVIVAVVGAAVLGVRWVVGRARARLATPANRAGDHAD